jgi:hypothetical protein
MRRIAPLLCLLAFAIPVANAQANPNVQLSIMMDDDNLIYRGDTAREAALQRMKALGVDYVRVTVLWRVVAHRMKKAKRRHGSNPKAYPKVNWDRYDGLVYGAKRNGLGVYFNVTGPGPKWEHGKPPKSERKYADTWEPDAKDFGKFVQAVGKRYTGKYHDENSGRELLPRVSFWSLYNEPNQPGWLTPQYKGSTPWSPVLYRNLWAYGRQGLNDSGHGNDVVLIGETAPLGNTNTNPASPMYPKKFIREFFCANSNGGKLTGNSARRRNCSTLRRITPLNYTAWAHHPYTKKAAPTKRDADKDAITMANIGELPSYLDRMPGKRTPFASQNLVASTEYGYETNPPDPFSGISPAKQAEFINIGDYIAYKEPRIIANTQFLLRDVKGVKGFTSDDKRRWFTYQSGLLYANGKPKPSAVAYRFPLMVTDNGGSQTSLWGWLRFLPQNSKTVVQLQFKPSGAPEFAAAGDPVQVTNKNGFFESTVLQGGPGTWRAVFTNPYNGQVVASREVKTS